jgi:hypothetical protein
MLAAVGEHKSFRSIRAFGWTRGASSIPGLWVGVDRCGGTVRSPTLEEYFALRDARTRIKFERGRCEIRRAPAPWSEFAKCVVLSANSLQV